MPLADDVKEDGHAQSLARNDYCVNLWNGVGDGGDGQSRRDGNPQAGAGVYFDVDLAVVQRKCERARSCGAERSHVAGSAHLVASAGKFAVAQCADLALEASCSIHAGDVC